MRTAFSGMSSHAAGLRVSGHHGVRVGKEMGERAYALYRIASVAIRARLLPSFDQISSCERAKWYSAS
jgi:hypothetical protein